MEKVTTGSDAGDLAAVATDQQAEIAALRRDLEVEREQRSAARESLKSLLDDLSTCYAVTAPDGRFIDVNDAMCRYFGYARDELLGMSLMDVTHPDDRERSIRALDDARTGRTGAVSLEKRYVRKDGTVVWALTTANWQRDTRGEPVSITAIVRDITKRFEAEIALRESEKLYRTLVETSPDAIVLLDLEGNLVTTNDLAKRLYGTDDTAGISGMHFMKLIAPQDRERAAANFRKRLGGEPLEDIQYAITTNDGRSLLVQIRASLLRDEAGSPTHVIAVIRDVTEKMAAERALRRSEAMYRTIVETSPDSITVTDLEGTLVDVNAQTVRQHGFDSVDEIIGRAGCELIAPEDRREAAENLRDLIDGSDCGSIQYSVLRKDGTSFTCDTKVSLTKDLDGNDRVVAFSRDITDRKKAEDALRRSEERYRQLVDTIPDVTWSSNRAGKTVFISSNAEKIYGYTAEEIVESGEDLWFARIHPDDAVTVRGEWEALHAEAKPFNVEYRIQRKDGEWIWLHDRAIIRQVEGEQDLAYGVFTEITERRMAEATLASATQALKVSEENFRCLFNESTDGILLADPETKRFHLANDTFCKMTGYSPAQMTELGIQDLHPEEDLSRITGIFEKQARQEITLAPDMPLKRKDGSVFYADINSATIVQQGKTYLMGTFRDVTKRRSLESQLRQSQKMEAVGLLAGGIAHDFNNLLSVIIGYSDLSGMDVGKHDPVFEYIGEMRKAAKKAADLTGQLLAFSRKSVLDPTIVDLNETVSGMQSMLGRVLGADIDIALELCPDLMKTRIDEGQIEQVLMNLVINARDAMPSGGSLTIETANAHPDAVNDAGSLELEPGSSVMLSVADTGQGMDEKTIANAFEPFFTTKPKGRGTGLGLSTVFGIVKQSGGDIHLHSEIGKGTTFRIYLPAADGAEERPRPRPAGPVATSGTETILVVEDEEALLRLLESILGRRGYNVLKAANAGEALLECREHDGQVHLLLTDVVMPRMTGKELAGWMDSRNPETKVIYMSGYMDDAIASRGVLIEGAHFIGKPFTAEQVLSKIRAVLDEEA